MDDFTPGAIWAYTRIGGGVSLSAYVHGEWQFLLAWWIALPLEAYDY